MVEVPAVIAVTIPVLDTVAMAELLELQVPVSCCGGELRSSSNANRLVSIDNTGVSGGVTNTDRVEVGIAHTPTMLYRIDAIPVGNSGYTPVEEFTVATAVFTRGPSASSLIGR